MTQTSAPVQLDEVLTSLQSDTRADLQEVLVRLRPGAEGEPTAAEDADQDPDPSGRGRAKALNDSLNYSAAGAARHRHRQRGAARHAAARPAKLVKAGLCRRGARRQRGRAQGPRSPTSTGRWRRSRPSRATSRQTIVCCRSPRSSSRQPGASTASTPRSRRRARSPARSCRACARRRPRSRRRSRGSTRCAWSRRRARGPGQRPAASRRRPRWPSSPTTRSSCCPRWTRPAAASSRTSCPRATSRSTCRATSRDRRRELQGVLAEPGRALQRGPELRRQRAVRAVPAGRRHADPVHRQHATRRRRRCSPTRTCPVARARFRSATRRASRRTGATSPSATRTRCRRSPQRERGHGVARAMRRAIRKHLRDFIAIIFLVIVAAGIGGYILSNQRFYLPAWVPGIGSDFYTSRRSSRPARRSSRPGPDGQHRRRQGRRHRRGRARGRRGRRRAEDPGQVQADLPRRDDAPAPEDRAEGHVRRARPGHAGGRRVPEGGRIGLARRCPT